MLNVLILSVKFPHFNIVSVIIPNVGMASVITVSVMAPCKTNMIKIIMGEGGIAQRWST